MATAEAPTTRVISVVQDTSLAERYEPRGIDDAYRLATYLAKSGTLGGTRSPENVLAVMIAGAELGVRSMQALRSIHIIDGKPTLAADLMLALCKRSPVCRYFRLVKTDGTIATYETLREGDPESTQMSYTIEQARQAELTGKQNWKRYPDAMLRARCITALARVVYPDLFMGVYDPDELGQSSDSPPPRVTVIDATPAEDAPAEAAQPPAPPVVEPQAAAPAPTQPRATQAVQGGNVTYPAGAVPELGRCQMCGGFFFAKTTRTGSTYYQCKGKKDSGEWCNSFAERDAVAQYQAGRSDLPDIDDDTEIPFA